MTSRVSVNEAYRAWTPPDWVRPAVYRVLDTVDPRYLRGLESVVLTNTSALTSKRKRGKTWSRRHKVRLIDCRGLYHAGRNGQGAWIEIFVDNVIDGAQTWVFRLPLICDLYVADTLLHELGHHIHATRAPEFRQREDVADVWRARLMQEMFRGRHPLIYATKRLVFGRRPMSRQSGAEKGAT